ncbi:MAG: hypothetical protein ACRBM6_27740 [Geminicoccales bacterium]
MQRGREPDQACSFLLSQGESEGAEDQQFFAELHDNIVTLLSRSSDIAVIGRKAQEWTSKAGRSVRAIGEDLKVRDAVSGEIVKCSDLHRLSIHFLETATGSSIWSENFNLDGNDVKDGVLINKIVGNIASEILRSEAEKTLRREPGQLGAEDLTHRANHSFAAFNQRTFHEIESLARLAVDLKPSFPGGYGILAGAMSLKACQSWTSSPDEDLEEALSMGSRAVELSPGDPRMLYWWGHVHFYGGRTHDAIGILESAAARDPSFVPTYILLGAAMILSQQAHMGITKIEHALDLSRDHALAFRAQFWLGVGQNGAWRLGSSASGVHGIDQAQRDQEPSRQRRCLLGLGRHGRCLRQARSTRRGRDHPQTSARAFCRP